MMACRKEGSKRAKLNIGMHLERTPPELAVDSGKRKISNKTTNLLIFRRLITTVGTKVSKEAL